MVNKHNIDDDADRDSSVGGGCNDADTADDEIKGDMMCACVS